MAMYKPAAHIDTIRGSIGGTTYSRNRPGNFMRSRVTPRDPQSLLQLLQRSAHTVIVDRWRNTLDNAERVVWNDLALTTDFHSPTCRSYHPSGFSLYLRANVFRLTCSLEPEDVPDTTAAAAPPTFTVASGAVAGHSYITATGDWEDGKTGHIGSWVSPPLSQSTYYYRGPWRFETAFAIAALANLPYRFDFYLPIPAGTRRFCRFKALFGTQGTIITWPRHDYWDRA